MSQFRLTDEQFAAHQRRVSDARTVRLGISERPPKRPKPAKRPAKVRHATEHVEQCFLMAWWASYAAAHGLDERLLFAIPNGANKSMAAAMKFKREGLRKGVPDLMLAVNKTIYETRGAWTANYPVFSGLLIEMKRIGEKANDDQLSYHALLRAQGYQVEVCAGADAAIKVIEEYLA